MPCRPKWLGGNGLCLPSPSPPNPSVSTTHYTPHATPQLCLPAQLQSAPSTATMEQRATPSPSHHSSYPILRPTPNPAVSWSPSKTAPAILDTASLPIARAHKGWDRAPHSPLAEQTKVKKVWRRYESRQQQEEPAVVEVQSSEIAHPSPVRVVKKLRIKSPRRLGHVELEAVEDEGEEERSHAPTRWDHRSNRLRRMLRIAVWIVNLTNCGL